MKVFGVVVFPLFAELFHRIAKVTCFENHRVNHKGRLDHLDLPLDGRELLEFYFIALQLGLVLELLYCFEHVLFPDPFVLREFGQEVIDLVFGALNGAGQQ